MPLTKSPTKQAFKKNMKAEVAAGKPRDQALAIAYRVQREARKNGYADGGRTFYDKLKETTIGRIVQDVTSAAMAPGRAYQSTPENPVTTEQMIKPATDLAGLVVGTPGTPASSLGSSLRQIPRDNYLKPLKEYTDVLYRETSPQSALEVMPFSNVFAGSGPGGPQRLYYADVPELALGQGTNKGVRMKYDANAFQGQINRKPGWEVPFQSGSAEYLAFPLKGSDIRDAVRSVEVDTSLLKQAPKVTQMQISRALKAMQDAGWKQEVSDNVITWSRPEAFSNGGKATHMDQKTGQRSHALSIARRVQSEAKKAAGGSVSSPPFYARAEARNLEHAGMIHSPVAGRTDRLPMNVKSGAYVIPADVVSGLGQGNSMAGAQGLGRMLKSGPYGAPKGGMKPMSMRPPRLKADGGEVTGDPVEIVAAGGEYVIPPEQVAELGGGDLSRGHDILDAFVKQVRSKTIKTLSKLPGPKKN